MKSEQTVDLAVIGGGPAGSMLATLVAQAGFEAIMFESARFPRFQIGESLLPVANLALQPVGIDLDAVCHTKLVDHLFFAERPDPEMRAGLITTLAGDVWREDNRFQNRLLSSPRRSFQVEQSSTGIARPF